MATSTRTASKPMLAGMADQAYLSIRESILRGDLKLGAPLSRRQLAEDLGMSVLPVTEALQRLEAEGFVETRHRAGTRVRVPTAEDIRDQYIIREALESQAGRLCAERATLTQRQELRRMADQVDVLFDRGIQQADDAEFQFTILSQHFQLHVRIAEYAGCRGLLEEIEKKQVLHFNWLYTVATHGRRLPPGFHRDLLTQITGSDPEAADKAMRNHIRYGLDEVLTRLPPHEVQKWRL